MSLLQLWPALTERLSTAPNPADVIILVQRVPTHSDFGGTAAPEAAAAAAAAAGAPTQRGLVSSPQLLCRLAGGRDCNPAGDSSEVSSAAGEPAEPAGHPSLALAPLSRTLPPALASHQPQRQRGARHCRDGACFYGLVVQPVGGPARSGGPDGAGAAAEGCYLLKTVKADGYPGGYSCTHFSLTRVCAGGGLEQQFMAAWLA